MRYTIRDTTLMVVCALWVCAAVAVTAQEVKAPELSETAKLRIVVAVQQVELWQLRAQAAQQELVKASEAAQLAIAAACGEAFALNLQTMGCEKK